MRLLPATLGAGIAGCSYGWTVSEVKNLSNRVIYPHPRARRYLFVATVELTEVQSEAKVQERTSDLSLFGCRVETHKPFPAGAKVRIRIAHGSAKFAALGRVSYTTPDGGMGIVFTQIEPTNQLVLEKWVEKLRDLSTAN